MAKDLRQEKGEDLRGGGSQQGKGGKILGRKGLRGKGRNDLNREKGWKRS